MGQIDCAPQEPGLFFGPAKIPDHHRGITRNTAPGTPDTLFIRVICPGKRATVPVAFPGGTQAIVFRIDITGKFIGV